MSKKHLTCIGCGLTHKKVEAGGIWYCPNPACSATGAFNHKRKMKSFCEEEDCCYVDSNDVIQYTNEHEDEMDDVTSIYAELMINHKWGQDGT